jgi:hypothetical protein
MVPTRVLFILLLITLTAGCKSDGSRAVPPPDLFHAPVFYAVGTGPTCIVTADFNADSIPDLITCNMGSNNLSVLLGNGDGTFNAQIVTPMNAKPQLLAAGEFTGDSYPDLVIIDSVNALLAVMVGKGDGTFQGFQQVKLEKTPTSILTADFNLDQHLDIAVSFRLDEVMIFSGNGRGFFQLTNNFDPGDTPTGMTTTDLNHDGNLDLIIANNGFVGRSIAIFHGKGDGTFNRAANYPSRFVPLIVGTNDFTQDEILDIVVIYGERNTLGLLPGQKDGTYKDPLHFGAQGGPSDLIPGDYNHDGNLDLAVTNNLTHNLSILLGKGDGTFNQPPIDYQTGGKVPTSVTSGLFVKGQSAGLAVANNGSHSVAVFIAKESKPVSPTTAFDPKQ